MRRALVVGLGIAAALVAAAFAGCGDSGETSGLFTTSSSSSTASSTGAPACVPGVQIACACPGGRQGAQRCAADGSSYGPCDGCGGGGAGGSTAASTSGSGGGAGGIGTGGGAGGIGTGGGAADAGPDDDAGPIFADAGTDGAPCPTWADVWAILDSPEKACTATGLCHGSGKGGLTLEHGQPAAAWATLLAYTLQPQPGPAKKYVVPGDTGLSGMTCNLTVDDGDGGQAAPWGACGTTMPFSGIGASLSMGEITTIADWIACGATEL